jgi:hypothetical protein
MCIPPMYHDLNTRRYAAMVASVDVTSIGQFSNPKITIFASTKDTSRQEILRDPPSSKYQSVNHDAPSNHTRINATTPLRHPTTSGSIKLFARYKQHWTKHHTSKENQNPAPLRTLRINPTQPINSPPYHRKQNKKKPATASPSNQ